MISNPDVEIYEDMVDTDSFAREEEKKSNRRMGGQSISSFDLILSQSANSKKEDRRELMFEHKKSKETMMPQILSFLSNPIGTGSSFHDQKDSISRNDKVPLRGSKDGGSHASGLNSVI